MNFKMLFLLSRGINVAKHVLMRALDILETILRPHLKHTKLP